MKTIKCKCGRSIPKENHTGMCELEHYLSYNCGVLIPDNRTALIAIAEHIKKDAVEDYKKAQERIGKTKKCI